MLTRPSAQAARFAVLLFVSFARPSRAEEILPLDQVRAGMVGVGRTVFQGSRIEEFRAEIIGVLENAVAPKHGIVMARLTGGPLAETGVIAGMSGSPVYVDGRLVGAVAFGFPFSKETIAGITPAADMIEATALPTTARAGSTRFPATAGWPGRTGLFDPQVFRSVLRERIAEIAGGNKDPLGSFRPLALPMSFGGFDRSAFDAVQDLFAGLGYRPVMGAADGAAATSALPDLEPGSPVGVSLVEGDLDISVTGTVTHIDGDRVYAFGHPFYNLGPTRFPLKKAYVHGVFPSAYQSWKIASAREPIGTLEQDRPTGVAGRIGQLPRMIPVNVRLKTSRGVLRSFAFRMVDDEFFSPLLAYASLFSLLQANERAFGTSSMHVDATLNFSGGRRVHVQDLYTDKQPALQSAALVAAPIAYVLSNNFEPVRLETVEVDVTSHETVQSAVVERVWIEGEGPARPGSTVPVRVQLRTYRGERLTHELPIEVPANAREGTYSLLVADASTLDGLDQRAGRESFTPRSLDQLVRAINALRPSNHVYARLVRADEGVFVSGEHLPSLPPSALSILRGAESAGDDLPLRTTTVSEFDLDAGQAVAGWRALSVAVKR